MAGQTCSAWPWFQIGPAFTARAGWGIEIWQTDISLGTVVHQ